MITLYIPRNRPMVRDMTIATWGIPYRVLFNRRLDVIEYTDWAMLNQPTESVLDDVEALVDLTHLSSLLDTTNIVLTFL